MAPSQVPALVPSVGPDTLTGTLKHAISRVIALYVFENAVSSCKNYSVAGIEIFIGTYVIAIRIAEMIVCLGL